MISAIIEGIFNLILTLFDFIFGAIFSAIFALFPNLTVYMVNVIDFLTLALTYVGLSLDILLVPTSVMQWLFSYFMIKYSIYLIMSTVRFILSIYNNLKI